MPPDAGHRITGAGRLEPADGPDRREDQARERQLVEPNQGDEDRGEHEELLFAALSSAGAGNPRARAPKLGSEAQAAQALPGAKARGESSPGSWGAGSLPDLCGPALEPGRGAAELGGHVGEAELVGARADDHDAIETIGNDARVEAKRLAQEALRAIALHGAADLAGCNNTHPRLRGNRSRRFPSAPFLTTTSFFTPSP